jgi:C4-dicarboxylate-specific signal transduction histidine kinase
MDEARELISKQELLLTKKIEELTQKDKMLTQQSKQAVMGEMISMIAHQWRQPLSTVTLSISNIQLKKLLGEKIDDKEIDKVLDTVSDTVVYLSETIEDFKTYFKPNKTVHTLYIEEILSKVINFTKPRIKNKNITIRTHIFENVEVQTYSNELIQVLLNIINNAIDEIVDRKVENGIIDIDVRVEGERVVIAIQDNAGGIKQENIQSIFEPYVSTKGKNGTGLGLYMSQMIMQKQFNSKIEVQTDSQGATFLVCIRKKLV